MSPHAIYRYQDPSGAVLLITRDDDDSKTIEIFSNVTHATVQLPKVDAREMVQALALDQVRKR